MRTFAALAVAVLLSGFAAADDKKGHLVEFASMKSTTPGDWKEETPTSSMRAYQFKLPKAEGDKADAELALFFFKGKGSGSLEDNLKRQVKKFKPADGKDKVEEKTDKIKVGSLDATLQDVSGKYEKKPFPMAESGTLMPGYRQLYVVFENNDGQYYMTLLGPTKTVEKHKKGFEEWLKNFK